MVNLKNNTVKTLLLTYIMGGGLVLLLAIASPVLRTQSVYVQKGTHGGTISHTLGKNKIIADKNIFTMLLRITGLVPKAGEYEINVGQTPLQILIKMDSHDVLYRDITIVEGLSPQQVAKILDANMYLVGENTITDDDFLLPNTYKYTRGDSRKELILRMRNHFSSMAHVLWDNRTVDTRISTLREAVVLASIVEKETGLTSERPLVASVFLNRLKKGMPLQSDPTVIYALSNGLGKIERSLTRQDWKIKSPYNTYYISTLPPKAIAGVSKESLQAVLNPVKSDFFYFVANGQGGHWFAKTLEEHNKNVQKYKKIKNKK